MMPRIAESVRSLSAFLFSLCLRPSPARRKPLRVAPALEAAHSVGQPMRTEECAAPESR